ncbi:ABC transporter permease subunit [Paenisporosarcina cavernae]|uniref:ABC transporter permease subunit n=1 Tax=Paenisporosarcina cavernae TaxID=2320858 RepID=A0A385YSA5_9BACL|nr:ABC transporter permease subunit [Paenisporosarcina cavernae]AYC29506.1 ABC transporter permease subunit [Paenisporosarcina cavernae]
MYVTKKLFHNSFFVIGFVALFGMLLVSIGYSFIRHDATPTIGLLFDNDGRPLHAPYNFQQVPPLGTDDFSRNLLVVMIVGAKYTIGAAFFITFLRVFPSIWIGLFIHFFLRKVERPLKSIADALNYFPMTLLAYLILSVMLIQEARRYYVPDSLEFVQGPDPLSWQMQVVVYCVVLAVLFIPNNSILIANEVKRISRMEFIESSRTLGAGNWWIVSKHIQPFLVPQIVLMFLRDFIQILLLMAHLAVLGVFLGGYTKVYDVFGQPQLVSNSSEWAGLLGMWWKHLYTSYPWISFLPILFLTFLILSARAMMNGLQKELATMDSKREPITPNQPFEKSQNVPPFERISWK